MKSLQRKLDFKTDDRKIINQGEKKLTSVEEDLNRTLFLKVDKTKKNIDNLSNIINHIILNISIYQILETLKRAQVLNTIYISQWFRDRK